MKIQVIGYSGSGKSTFADTLSNHYNIKLLHIDKINFFPNWVERDKSEVEKKLLSFIQENDNWIIDGNYFQRAKERFETCDIIFFFNFNRFKCLYGAIKRRIKYNNKVRSSAPENCKERIDFAFFMWIMHSGRTKQSKKYYKEFLKTKNVIVFKKRKHVNKYLKSIDAIKK